MASTQSPIALSSVCLFVCKVYDTARTVKAIKTKLGIYMYLGSGYMCLVVGVDDNTDDVIRSTSMSDFEIVITLSIVKLERRSKSQNVGNDMAYLIVGLNFRYIFRFRNLLGPQNDDHFENFEIFQIVYF